jgi:spermidine/putrescine transport system substrate-binding protein
MEFTRNTLFVRTGIVFCWILCCGFLLTLPWISLYFRSRNTVTILAMPNALNVDMFAAFTQQTGIKVSLSYAENADEIGMKLRATRGSGYDLIMVADYQIPALIKTGVIQQLNKAKLTFFDSLYPALLNHDFDPNNNYSVPYYWGVYGFGIDKAYFDDTRNFSWSDLFTPSNGFMVGVRDDIRELIFIAAYYLFGTASDLTDEQYVQIQELLIAQKRCVVMYADERIDSLLISKTSPLILTLSGDISRVLYAYPALDFVIPEDGSFVDIDSLVLSAACNNNEAAYQFLNYLYSVPVLSYYMEHFRLSSPLSMVNSYVKIPFLARPTEEFFSQLRFFDTVIPQSRINAILVALKSA